MPAYDESSGPASRSDPGEFCIKHRADWLSYALAHTRNRRDAEDAVSHVVVKILQYHHDTGMLCPPKYDDPIAWSRTVIVNWAQAIALTQGHMLDAPFQDSRDASQRGPALWRSTGFLPAFASRYGRLLHRCGSALHNRGIVATAGATAVILLTVSTLAAVGPRPASPALRRVSPIPASYGVQFPPGEFTLSNADKDTLDGLVNRIEQSAAPVTISGYADDSELALKRAEAVAAFLETRGISASRLRVQGVRLHVPGPGSRSVTIFIWGQNRGNG